MKPDLILKNAAVRTLDPERPFASAVALARGWISAVGSDSDILHLARPETRVLDLGGRPVLPGFTDSHFHYYDWAMGRKHLDLAPVKTFAECMELVARAAAGTPPGSWILGLGWNESDWPDGDMPDRSDLDRAAPDHPAALWRCDLHLCSVNSPALERAGITPETPDPPDGVIARDPSGRPTGILRELAPNLIKEAIAESGDAGVYEAMEEGIPVLHSYGITGLYDVKLMGGVEGPPALRAWQKLRERSLLDLRCWVSLPGERLEEALALGLRTGLGDDRLTIGHLKFFMDGGMGARTAWMIDPYLDAECGMPLCPPESLREWVLRAEGSGLAVMIHAIGERANREAASVFEWVRRERDRLGIAPGCGPIVPHRVEHLQMIRPEDLARLSRLGLVGCIQPHNLLLDINMIERSVGERAGLTYAYRSMINAGLPLILSSDAPVCDPRPLVGIHAAVTRTRRDGTPQGGWYPAQSLTVDEAVRGYTTAPAAARGLGGVLGTVTPGKRGDLVALDRDIYRVDPAEIIEAGVDMTFFDGRLVYEG